MVDEVQVCGDDYDNDSPTLHYHVRGGDNYYKRGHEYHDHSASFVYNDDGNRVHDHVDSPAFYVNHSNTIHNNNAAPVHIVDYGRYYNHFDVADAARDRDRRDDGADSVRLGVDSCGDWCCSRLERQ